MGQMTLFLPTVRDLHFLAVIWALPDRDLVSPIVGSLALGIVAICRGDRAVAVRGVVRPCKTFVRLCSTGILLDLVGQHRGRQGQRCQILHR